jgi:hypothetical protein
MTSGGEGRAFFAPLAREIRSPLPRDPSAPGRSPHRSEGIAERLPADIDVLAPSLRVKPKRCIFLSGNKNCCYVAISLPSSEAPPCPT